ncbi:MAG: ribosome silencing factor [Hyphomicrobiales bacterium]|nr:ribosome silencing factor [Hyphomicrobiales bacterium]
MQNLAQKAPSAAANSVKDAPTEDRSVEILDAALIALEDAKAEDVVTIDLRGRSPLGDFMVIASGRSNRHVGAVADQLLRKFKDIGEGSARVEGLPQSDWVLIDTGDIIVHIFRPEVREFYKLEKMWSGERPAPLDAAD